MCKSTEIHQNSSFIVLFFQAKMVIRINGIPFGMTCSGNNNRSTISDAIIKKKVGFIWGKQNKNI